jgi:antitoxin (DNA-binding transcriptional repressor) of toxin-antitoxin stability system
MTMIKVNIHQIKTHFSAYLQRLRPGETLVVCRRNTPVAELRLLPQRRRKARPIGLAAGEFQIPPEFFEPLPEETVEAFRGAR